MIRTGLYHSRRLGLFAQAATTHHHRLQWTTVGGRLWLSTLRRAPWTPSTTVHQRQYVRTKKDESNLSALFKPVPVKASPSDDSQVGAELCGQLDKGELLKLLNRFTQKRETKLLCQENGLDSKCGAIEVKYISLYIVFIISIRQHFYSSRPSAAFGGSASKRPCRPICTLWSPTFCTATDTWTTSFRTFCGTRVKCFRISSVWTT